MRDIDFEELDAAVSQFLDSGHINQPAKKNDSQPTVKEEIARPMVFLPRTAPVSAGAFHAGGQKSSPVAEDKSDAILTTILPENTANNKAIDVSIKDDFKEKNHRNPVVKKDLINDELISREYKNKKFELPVLDVVKDNSAIASPAVSSVNQENQPDIKNEADNIATSTKHEPIIIDNITVRRIPRKPTIIAKNIPTEIPTSKTDQVEPVIDSDNIKESGIIVPDIHRQTSVAVPNRPGVYPITETVSPLKTFGKEVSDDMVAAKVPQINEDNHTGDEEKINIRKNNTIKTPVLESKFDKMLSQAKADLSINNAYEMKNEVNKSSIESKVIENKPEIATPFLQNASVQKRPLGASDKSTPLSPHNFGSKENFAHNIRQSKKMNIENRQSHEPILSREEYAAPVENKKRKSSGWGAFFAILLMIILATGAGLAVYYFNFMK